MGHWPRLHCISGNPPPHALWKVGMYPRPQPRLAWLQLPCQGQLRCPLLRLPGGQRVAPPTQAEKAKGIIQQCSLCRARHWPPFPLSPAGPLASGSLQPLGPRRSSRPQGGHQGGHQLGPSAIYGTILGRFEGSPRGSSCWNSRLPNTQHSPAQATEPDPSGKGSCLAGHHLALIIRASSCQAQRSLGFLLLMVEPARPPQF